MNFFKSHVPNPDFILDATFGRGGHTEGFLKLFPKAKVYAIDCDHAAIESGTLNFSDSLESKQLSLFHRSFLHLSRSELGVKMGFDIILMDLGVSSPQLNKADRGLSFRLNGPLDMRLDQRTEKTAANLINQAEADELRDIFQNYGEIQRPGRVIEAIVEKRKKEPFLTTNDLSRLIERIDGWRKRGHHPATRYFMALRIAVNNELSTLRQALPEILALLKSRGILGVISFHSLEDRLVKTFFKEQNKTGGEILNKKVIKPKRSEVLKNPRSRSAKLRFFQKM